MPSSRRGRAYKEMTVQQLRSFGETARLGSLKAAANSLGLAAPTVWEQVHALEKLLGMALIEPHGRGCLLTDEGRLLADRAAPIITSIDALKREILEARSRIRPRLTVATTQRTLIEDLPDSIVEFERRHPEVQLCLKEVATRQVIAAVEAGEADLGLSVVPPTQPPNPRLKFEPAYQLDHILVTPRDHPLARRRFVRLTDLVKFPLVNASDGIPDPAVTAILDKHGAFRTEPRRIEAYLTAVIRLYVKLGFGIGLVTGLPSTQQPPGLHERSLSRLLGKTIVHSIWRKGLSEPRHAREFADLVKEKLCEGASKSARAT